MPPPWRCRMPKNARRAALHRMRGSYWENSTPSAPFRSYQRCEIAQPSRQAPRAKQMAAANGKLNNVVHMSHSYERRGGARPVSLPPARVLLRIVAGNGLGCAPYSGDCLGSSTFAGEHGALLKPLREPRTAPIFEPGFMESLTLVCHHDWKHFAGIRSR